MAVRVQHKRRTTSGQVPVASDVLQGELVLNSADGRIWTKNASNALIEIHPDQPRFRAQFTEDFFSTQGWQGSLIANNSVGTTTTGAGEQDAPGILTCSTTTGTTARAGLITNTSTAIRLGANEAIFEWRIRIPTLSDATNNFTVRGGFMSDMGGDAPNGVFWRYNHGVNSGNWQGVARTNNSESATNFSTAPITTGWQRMTIVVNAAGTLAEFFINGTLVGSVTSNIPTANSREIAIGFGIIKTTGSTARTLLVDYVYFCMNFSSQR